MTLPTFNIPPVGPKQSKIWGDTQLIFAHYGIECHRIHFLAGAYCSRHLHQHKWNRFVVLSGKLKVSIFQNGDRASTGSGMDETELGVGQITDVPPGVLHQFEGIEDGEALEFYWTVLSENDIERVRQGGKR